jgi:hypothetical protein
MRFGDLQGKNKIYDIDGEPILQDGEKIKKTKVAYCGRGWRRYKLGWRTILFEGEGIFYFTNQRIIFIRSLGYQPRVHTFNVKKEMGDFGGNAYRAHRANRAVQQGGYDFLEIPLNEIQNVEIEDKKGRAVVFVKDEKNKFKLYFEMDIGKELKNFF